MNDDGYNELLEASWRRKLTVEEERQLQSWLAADPARQADWEEETVLTQQLERLPDAPMASNFTAQVLGKLDLELRREEREADGVTFRSGSATSLPWWRRLLPRFAAVLLLGLLGGTALVQYREYQRNQVAYGVMQVAPVASVLQPDVLQNFDAIQQLGQVHLVSDDELVAALQ
jgi:anti-sigma factor RsiW